MMKQLLTFSFLILISLGISPAQVTVKTITQPFNGSGGVRVGTDGNVYVADFGSTLNNANGTNVTRVSPTGNMQTWASGLVGASGNDFGPDGHLFQSNISAGRVSKINPFGFVGGFSIGHSAPVGVAVDSSGNVYVAECGGNIISKVDPSGFVGLYATSALFNCPNGLILGPDDKTLYCCNFSDGNVLKIDSAGNVTILATLPGNNNGHLTFANDRLYVVDRGGNQIFEVGLNGSIVLLAGTGQRGNRDGAGNQATFSAPNGIDASVTGDTLYVNDAIPLSGPNLNPVVVRMILLKSNTSVDQPLNQASAFLPNIPNPFTEETEVRFRIPKSGFTVLTLWDVMGKKVQEVLAKEMAAGEHSVTLVGKELPVGTYLLKIEGKEVSETLKIVRR